MLRNYSPSVYVNDLIKKNKRGQDRPIPRRKMLGMPMLLPTEYAGYMYAHNACVLTGGFKGGGGARRAPPNIDKAKL